MVRRSTRVSNASSSVKSPSKRRAVDSSESEFEDGNSSGSDFETSRKVNGNKRVRTDTSTPEGDEDEDKEEEDSDDESQPPKVTIIPLPKAREVGDIPYEDGRIHENTMLFLRDLKVHNNREWMRCSLPFHPEIYSPCALTVFAVQSTTRISGTHRKTSLLLSSSCRSWSRKRTIRFLSCRVKT